jgi:hypothetical protein
VKGNDYNRDGIGDLVGINEQCLYRWHGDGSGSFGTGVRLGCGWGPYEGSIAGAGDLNRDGVGDLVAFSSDSHGLYGWLGDGAGSLTSGSCLGHLAECAQYNADQGGNIAGAGYINRDGDGDLVIVFDDDLYRWNGNGKFLDPFGTRVLLGSGWTPYWSMAT